MLDKYSVKINFIDLTELLIRGFGLSLLTFDSILAQLFDYGDFRLKFPKFFTKLQFEGKSQDFFQILTINWIRTKYFPQFQPFHFLTIDFNRKPPINWSVWRCITTESETI